MLLFIFLGHKKGEVVHNKYLFAKMWFCKEEIKLQLSV